MKRKYGDHAGWARIAERVFTVAQVETPAFRGVASLYTIQRVREPLYKPVAGEMKLIADDGFRWLQLYSADAQHQTYTVTTMFTSENLVAQWYIDICAGHGINQSGIPWHDDLYLDLVVNERGGLAIVDAADLESAVESGAAPLAAYHLAWSEAHRLAPLARDVRLLEMRLAGEALGAMQTIERGGAVAGYTRLATQGAGEVTGVVIGEIGERRAHDGACKLQDNVGP